MLALAVIFISFNCVSVNWHQRWRTCWVLRREGWRNACCHQQCPAVICSPWCISATCQVSIEEVRQVMTRSPVKVPLSTETVEGVRRLKIGCNWSYAPLVKNFWLRHWLVFRRVG